MAPSAGAKGLVEITWRKGSYDAGDSAADSVGLIRRRTGVPAAAAEREPLFEGLGSYTRTVTTSSPERKRYFDQGLAFLHGFNHGAAIRAFQEAARIDPEFRWRTGGSPWRVGRTSTSRWSRRRRRSWRGRSWARRSDHAAAASPVERDLIAALATRYAKPQPEDRSPLDRAYADAMRKVWAAHGDDPDVGASSPRR